MKNAGFLITFACILHLTGCSRPTSAPAEQPKSNAPSPRTSPAPMPQLAPGECGAPDGSRGFVRINASDLTGTYQRCSFELSNDKIAAMEAKQVGDKESSMIVLSLIKTGTVPCEKDSPGAVNYRAQSPPRALYVASGGKLGKCEITNTAIDAKHWAGKVTATLVPGGQDQGKKSRPIRFQVEWDIRKP
jgi:hypothetical protein